MGSSRTSKILFNGSGLHKLFPIQMCIEIIIWMRKKNKKKSHPGDIFIYSCKSHKSTMAVKKLFDSLNKSQIN